LDPSVDAGVRLACLLKGESLMPEARVPPKREYRGSGSMVRGCETAAAFSICKIGKNDHSEVGPRGEGACGRDS